MSLFDETQYPEGYIQWQLDKANALGSVNAGTKVVVYALPIVTHLTAPKILGTLIDTYDVTTSNTSPGDHELYVASTTPGNVNALTLGTGGVDSDQYVMLATIKDGDRIFVTDTVNTKRCVFIASGTPSLSGNNLVIAGSFAALQTGFAINTGAQKIALSLA
ncbi:hypothetical protein [Vibrio phage vB_VneS_J26]